MSAVGGRMIVYWNGPMEWEAVNAAMERDAQRIAAQEKRIGELTAERDEARHRNAQVELEAVEYSNRMHDAIARAEAAEARVVALNIECGELQGQLEAAELALTAERQRIKDLEDDRDSWRYIAEADRKAERQRREACEAALREIIRLEDEQTIPDNRGRYIDSCTHSCLIECSDVAKDYFSRYSS